MSKKIDWVAIRKEWETSKVTFKALAEKHGVKLGTLKSRRSREKWSREKDATTKQKVATQNREVATPNENKASSNRQRKRSGNPNPKNQFTKRNKAAERHGFFSEHLPDETLDLLEQMESLEPVNMLWDQIRLQYAAIIRAQQIMYVSDISDTDKIVSERGDFTTKYEIHTAWDKHAKFLSAQSRAMAELRNLIKQFVSIADEADERRLKIESMQANIDKTNAEITRMKGDDFVEYESDGFLEAIAGIDGVWKDDN